MPYPQLNELMVEIRAAYDRGSKYYAWRLFQVYKRLVKGEEIPLWPVDETGDRRR